MTAKARISIVIPAKNEESLLPGLLDCIRAQSRPPFEVIIGDAGSTDRTVEIAREYGCMVVEGGLPATGRNSGAGHARGELVLFLDSDVRIDPGFLKKVSHQVRARRLECGTAYNIPVYRPGDKGYTRISIRMLDRLIYFLHNAGLVLSAMIRYPYATGTCMFCDRKLFAALGGFDETLSVFEDSEFANRSKKVARYGVIKKPPVYISTRRFDQQNRILFFLYLTFRGFVARAIIGEKRRGDYFNNEVMKLQLRERFAALAARASV